MHVSLYSVSDGWLLVPADRGLCIAPDDCDSPRYEGTVPSELIAADGWPQLQHAFEDEGFARITEHLGRRLLEAMLSQCGSLVADERAVDSAPA